MNLPNRITMARLFVALLFFMTLGVYRIQHERVGGIVDVSDQVILDVALGLFLLAVATDAIDGYVARKYKMITVFGRIADPFVDKIVICGAFVFLVSMNQELGGLVWPGMVLVIIGREFLVTSLRALLEGQGKDFSAATAGKVKMIVQSSTVAWILFYRANLWPQGEGVAPELAEHGYLWARYMAVGTLWITVVVTLYSGIDYLVRARRLLLKSM